MAIHDKVDLIGVPLDLGVKELGLKLGPDTFRKIGLTNVLRYLGIDVRDIGNIPLPVLDGKMRGNNQNEMLIAAYCKIVAKVVEESLNLGRLPVCLGGDHSLAIASVAGATTKYGRIGCFWLDAHPDANTPETSPSGNIHGMVMAIALGHGPEVLLEVGPSNRMIDYSDVSLIGTQDIDSGEFEFIERHEMQMFTIFDILEQGLSTVMDHAIDRVTLHTKKVHVSMDLDVLHQDVAPGVGLPSQCGLNVREAMYLCRRIASACQITSIDIVGLNPVRDQNWKTARLAVELLTILLGKPFSFDYFDYLKDQGL